MARMSKMQINNAVLSALGHPIRRKILQELNGDTKSPKMLADELGVNIGVVSYHVRMLADAKVIKLVSTKARRGAVEHYYARAGNAIDKAAKEVQTLVGKD